MAGEDAVAALLEREAIRLAIMLYARAVDRGDWQGVRAAYHLDAHDDHGAYKGDIDGLIAFLKRLLAGAGNGTHFIGNCLVELAGPDLALAETYFISQRLRAPGADDAGCGPDDRMCRLGWGRYVDRFEKRDGAWRVARRIVVMDAIFSTVALDGVRAGASAWGTRDADDPVFKLRAELFGA